MKKIAFLLLCSILLITASCDDKEETKTALPPGKDIKFMDAKSYTEWVYFSFAKGETVKVTDFQNDLSWDIAFHRGDVRLNGGASGKGKAEVVNTKVTDWNGVLEAPVSGYKKDQMGSITIAFVGDGINEEQQPFSQELTSWLTVDTSNPPPKYTLHNWVYVLKTADGNYVKLQIYDNKDVTNKAAGFVSFRYLYNEIGNDKFY